MRISAVAFLMILTTVFLSGCAQERKVASVEDRGNYYYGRSVVAQQRAATVMAAPVSTVVDNGVPFGRPSKPLAPAAIAATPAPQPIIPQAPVEQATTQSAPVESPAPKAMSEEGMMAMGGTSWQWPVQGKVIQQFGSQKDGTSSEGITIAAAEGSPIRAAQSGEVAYVGHNVRDYGNMIILRHADGTLSSYSHAREITVKKGDRVEIGSVIGAVGASGSASSPQLHFALREEGRAVDPLVRLPQNIASNLI